MFTIQKSARKIIPSIFWDKDGIVFIVYLPQVCSVIRCNIYNREHSCQSTGKIKTENQEKTPREVDQPDPFLHNIAPILQTTISKVVSSKLRILDFQLIKHRPYSRDLVASDYYLFPNMNRKPEAYHFADIEGDTETEGNWLMDQSNDSKKAKKYASMA